MRNLIFVFVVSLSLWQCNNQKELYTKDYAAALSFYTEQINASSLKSHLYIFASDAFEGRATGEEGQIKAANYIRDFYVKHGIVSPQSPYVNNYSQTIPAYTFSNVKKPTDNILGFIPGSEKPNEIVVVSAHYDHVGMENGVIYNGADDDGSGSVALLEMAQAFKQAEKDGYSPKRSILFIHFTGEELGLLGSRYYTDIQPVFPLKNTIVNLNIDMIGRVDAAHLENPEYVYIIGSDFLSKDLHHTSEISNQQCCQLTLDYTYNSTTDPNQFYYRSDHYNFAKNNIPVIFYFNGVHEDYHQPGDTPDKINYDILAKRTQLVFATAWNLANGKKRPIVNVSK